MGVGDLIAKYKLLEEDARNELKGISSLKEEFREGELSAKIIMCVEIVKELSEFSEGFCEWKKVDEGMFGIPDIEIKTECGKSLEPKHVKNVKHCPECGKLVRNIN